MQLNSTCSFYFVILILNLDKKNHHHNKYHDQLNLPFAKFFLALNTIKNQWYLDHNSKLCKVEYLMLLNNMYLHNYNHLILFLIFAIFAFNPILYNNCKHKLPKCNKNIEYILKNITIMICTTTTIICININNKKLIKNKNQTY